MDIKNVYKFINSIIYETDDTNKQIFLVLSARGFLLDLKDNIICISDNSSKKDLIDLNNFLIDNEIGSIKGNTVNSNSIFSNMKFSKLFTETQEVSYECINWKRDWKYFKQHVYGSIVDVLELEPYIARYIKALSSIGINTSMSCDGNHINAKNITAYIRFNSRYDNIWHRIVGSILNLNLKWEQDFSLEKAYINIDNKAQVDTYLDLLKDANKIYADRICLRKLKLKTTKYAHQINKKIDRLSNEEVYNLIIECVYSDDFNKKLKVEDF